MEKNVYTKNEKIVFKPKGLKMVSPCPKCGKEFSRNCDLTRHLNRKTPCRSEDAIAQATVSQLSLVVIGSDSPGPAGGTNLMPLFDIARSEGIVGIDAVNHISYFLMLKLIEPYLDTEEYRLNRDKTGYPEIVDSVIQNKHHYWSILTRMAQDEEHLILLIRNIFISLRSNDMLKNHFPVPTTLKFNGTSNIVRRIINAINEIDVSGETFGDVYEDMLGRQMIGKDLGQFFTPYWVRKFVVSLINPQRREDGTIPSICDPAAGTAGFLSSALRHLKKQGELKDVEKSIFGVEINQDTFSGGLKHLMITTKKHTPGFILGDSLRKPPEIQFDYIFSNPPFGLKGVKWEECPNIPVKINNGTALFLQRIIQLLKVGGTAGIVFPMGQEMFSGGDLAEVRMLLLKTCRLDAVIKLPKQTFLNTACSTCILMFTKVYDSSQVMGFQMKGKSQQIRAWATGGATSEVKFYEIDDVPLTNNGPEVRAIFSVQIAQIEAKEYSLRVEDYQVSQVVRSVKNNWPEYQLGQICSFKNGKALTKANIVEGPYPVVGGGQSPMGYHNEANVPEKTIIIAKIGAYSGYVSFSETPSFVTSNGLYVDKIHPAVSPGYLYLMLKYNLQDTIYKLQKGAAQPLIKAEDLAQLMIPVPPIEVQNQIVQAATNIQNRLDRLTSELDDSQNDYKKLNRLMIGQEYQLGKIARIDFGKRITKANNVEGEYPVYGGGDITFYTNSFNREGYNIVISRFGVSAKCVRILRTQFFLNDSGMTVSSLGEYLNPEYLGFYLFNHQDEIYHLARGTAQKNIDIEQFKSLPIPVPPIDEQMKIVQKGNRITERIKLTEELIAELKSELASVVNDNL